MVIARAVVIRTTLGCMERPYYSDQADAEATERCAMRRNKDIIWYEFVEKCHLVLVQRLLRATGAIASKVVGVGVLSTGEPPAQGVIRNLNSRQASPSFTASSRRHAANPVRQTTCRRSPFLLRFSLIIKPHAK
jgi:hypothetical protein